MRGNTPEHVEAVEDSGRRVYVSADEILVGGYACLAGDDRDDKLQEQGFKSVGSRRRRTGDALADVLERRAREDKNVRTLLQDCGASRVESFSGPAKEIVVALAREARVADERIDETVIALPEWGVYQKAVAHDEGAGAFQRRYDLAAKAVGADSLVAPNHVYWTPEVAPVFRAAGVVAAAPRDQIQPGWKATPYAPPEPIRPRAATALPERPGGRRAWPVVAILDSGLLEERAAKGAPLDAMRDFARHKPFLRGSEHSDVAPAPAFQQPIDASVAHGMFATGIVIRQSKGKVDVDPEMTLGARGLTKSSEITQDLRSLLWRPGGPPDIVNMSFGSYMLDDAPTPDLVSALEWFGEVAPGTVFVASAGNDGDGRPFYPAACRNVVAVAATNADGMPMPWSNYGRWVDVCTLGDQVESDYFVGTVTFTPVDREAPPRRTFDGRATWSGTSFSAPIVSGLIAREMAARGGRTAREAYRYLIKGAPRVSAALPDRKRRFGRWLHPETA